MEAEPSVDPEPEIFPQWAIAVIVIGMASLAFVIVFGISMVSLLAFDILLYYFKVVSFFLSVA